MKKFFAIVLTVCLLASALCVAAFAADPAADVVLRVSALAKESDTSLTVLGDYKDFEEGWKAAMSHAKDQTYARIVVDFYTDWNATDGVFTDDWFINGTGFDNDTIFIPADVKVTLNLNGHAINRGLTKDTDDGEIIFINDDADVIINNGTLTGGYSNSEGGGLYIEGGANVTLNNVHLEGNRVHNDDGGSVAMYNGATLTMNGGSLKNNTVSNGCGGAIYASECTVILKNVEIKNNQSVSGNYKGAAIYADESTVLLEGCTVNGNGIKDEKNNVYAAISTIEAEDSTLTLKKTTFTNNGAMYFEEKKTNDIKPYIENVSSVITTKDSTLVIDENCSFSNNAAAHLIDVNDNDSFYISNSTFENNKSTVLTSTDHVDGSYFSNCVFNNNKAPNPGKQYTFVSYTFKVYNNLLSFYNCDLGDSNFCESDADYINIQSSDVSKEEAAVGVSALRVDGSVESTLYYKDIFQGWNYAMDLAMSGVYPRVAVDLYADWTAQNGNYWGGYGVGFQWNTVYFPENVRITLNLNGHTVNRNLSESKDYGAVMYIDSGADVIINNGTVTGGFSTNGAGGIQLAENAKVALNDVHVIGNRTNGASGAGISARESSYLTMKGGSIQNNVMNGSFGAGVYLYHATATFSKVEFKNNQGTMNGFGGAAIHSAGALVAIDECVFDGNGRADEAQGYAAAESIIRGGLSAGFIITNSTFTNNGSFYYTGTSPNGFDCSTLFTLSTSDLMMDNCRISGNSALALIRTTKESGIYVKNSTFTDNTASVMYSIRHTEDSYFESCTFNNNTPMENSPVTGKTFYINNRTFKFAACDLGNSVFEESDDVIITSSKDFTYRNAGSIFGEGSLTMIVAIVALIASVASIVVNVTYNKKKVLPAAVVIGESEEDKE